jgi:hypothetical protein
VCAAGAASHQSTSRTAATQSHAARERAREREAGGQGAARDATRHDTTRLRGCAALDARDEPVEALEETLALRRRRLLDGPLPTLDGAQTQRLGNLEAGENAERRRSSAVAHARTRTRTRTRTRRHTPSFSHKTQRERTCAAPSAPGMSCLFANTSRCESFRSSSCRTHATAAQRRREVTTTATQA